MNQLRILITRHDRIGDVVLSTPIPRAIKKQYPDSFVAVMLRPYTKDIYLNNPYVDTFILFDPDKDKALFWPKIKEVRQYNFTHALMLLPDERINYILLLAGIRKRVGVGYKFFQFISGVKGISRHKYVPLKHEAEYCLDLAKAIGIKPDGLKTEIFLTPVEKERVQELKINWAAKENKIIGIHSTSGNSSPNWKPDEYRRLISELMKNTIYRIVVTDNNIPEELKYIEGVVYPNINTNLRESILNFAALDLLVSSSTGPMHMAAALGVRSASLFCPITACSPELWGPQGNEHLIFLPEDDYCQKHCPGDPKLCTLEEPGGITFIKVADNINKFLNEPHRRI